MCKPVESQQYSCNDRHAWIDPLGFSLETEVAHYAILNCKTGLSERSHEFCNQAVAQSDYGFPLTPIFDLISAIEVTDRVVYAAFLHSERVSPSPRSALFNDLTQLGLTHKSKQ